MQSLALGIPLFLFFMDFYLACSLYILAYSGWIVFNRRLVILQHLKKVRNERGKIKNLDYHFITDDANVLDRISRQNLFEGLTVSTFFTYFIGLLDVFAIQYLLNEASQSQEDSPFIFFGLAVLIFIAFIGQFLSFAFKHTTLIYCLIPIVSAVIFGIARYSNADSILSKLPLYGSFIVYLMISLTLYLLITFLYPVFILRNLNATTVIIGSILTLIVTIFGYFVSEYLTQEIVINLNRFGMEGLLPQNAKSFLSDNKEFAELSTRFFEREKKIIVNRYIGIVSSGITLSFVLGGLLVTRKLTNAKKKAKKIYRNKISHGRFNYQDIKECGYYGGEEYENLLLTNPVTLAMILQEEGDLIIPKLTINQRIKTFFSRKKR